MLFMTTSMHDTILYEGYVYDIINVNGDGLITPQMYNMFPGFIGSDCKRDHISKYVLLDGFLLLVDMKIGPLTGQTAKRIQGKTPDESNTYREVNVWSRLMGSLKIARNPKKEGSEQAGKKDETDYETVIDILFQDGEFLLAREMSDKPGETSS
jgi:hypothetical protein